MTNIDIIILILFLAGVLAGYKAGLMRTVSLFVFLALGLVIAFQYENNILSFLRFQLHLPLSASYYITYLGIVCISIGIGLYIAGKITSLLKIIFLGWVNKLAGGIAGGAIAIILQCVIFNLLIILPTNKPVISRETVNKSLLIQPLTSVFRGEMEIENMEDYIKQRSLPTQQSPGG